MVDNMIESLFDNIPFYVHYDRTGNFQGLAFWCPIIIPANKMRKSKDGETIKLKHGSDIISLIDNKLDDLKKRLDDWIITVAPNYDTKEKRILLKYNFRDKCLIDKSRTEFNSNNVLEFTTKRLNGTKRILSESFYILEYWMVWEACGVKAIDSFIIGELFDIVSSCCYWPICEAFIYKSMIDILIEHGIYDPDPDTLYLSVGDSEWEHILEDSRIKCNELMREYIYDFPATTIYVKKGENRIKLDLVDQYNLMDSYQNIEYTVDKDFRRFKSLDVMIILNQDLTLYKAISDSILERVYTKYDYIPEDVIKDTNKNKRISDDEYFSIEFMNKIMEEDN